MPGPGWRRVGRELTLPTGSGCTLWVVRHAEVLLPEALQGQVCCYGATDLPARAEATQAAAHALAPGLRHLWHAGAPRWVSGLQRAKQMAEALDAAVASLPPLPCVPTAPALAPRKPLAPTRVPPLRWHTDSRLNEFNFGCWELKPWAGIPKAAVDEWTAHFPHHPFGGAETAWQMVQRVRAALRVTLAQLQACGQHEALWVAHAGTARALQVLQTSPAGELGSASDWPLSAPAPGSACAYVLSPDDFTH